MINFHVIIQFINMYKVGRSKKTLPDEEYTRILYPIRVVIGLLLICCFAGMLAMVYFSFK
jgi:hypothetical protein